MNQLQKESLILNLLLEFYPEECDIIGESNLDNIVGGYTKQVNTRGGDGFDFSDVIESVSLVVSFIGLILDYINYKREAKQKPSYEDFKNTSGSVFNGKIDINISINIYNKSETELDSIAKNETK